MNSIKDKKIIERTRTYLGSLNIKYYVFQRKDNVTVIGFRRKTHTLMFKKIIESLFQKVDMFGWEFLLGIIDGFTDGDGDINFVKNKYPRIRIMNTDKNKINSLRKICIRVNIPYQIYTYRNKFYFYIPIYKMKNCPFKSIKWTAAGTKTPHP